MKLATAIIVALITTNLNYGCAPLVVGGAAAGGAVYHSRRTAAAIMDDEEIEVRARLAIFEDKQLNSQIHINITSYNGIVLLSGEAPTEALRSEAESTVKAIQNVRKIHNEMIIAAPSSLTARSSDTIITAKVKTRVLGIRNIEGFDGTRVKVVTEDGTVYLMGLLTRNEADAVTAETRQVGGVQRVIKLFEYID